MVTSDFRPEVDMRPFRAGAMKNMQYNHYYRNSSVMAMGQIPRSRERISSLYTQGFIVSLLQKMTSSCKRNWYRNWYYNSIFVIFSKLLIVLYYVRVAISAI